MKVLKGRNSLQFYSAMTKRNELILDFLSAYFFRISYEDVNISTADYPRLWARTDSRWAYNNKRPFFIDYRAYADS
jgi:hypothetical protein